MTTPSALPISTVQSMMAEYNNYKNTLTNGLNALNAVIASGTIIYNDANFTSEFPNTIAAYKTYLLSVQTAINSFIAGFPVEPTLNG